MSFVVLDTDVASTSFLGRLPARLKSKTCRPFGVHHVRDVGRTDHMDGDTQLGTAATSEPGSLASSDGATQVRRTVAITWGHLQARAQLRGRPRPVNDTWIAACCLVEGLPLVTFNTKDYEDFAVHEGLLLMDVS